MTGGDVECEAVKRVDDKAVLGESQCFEMLTDFCLEVGGSGAGEGDEHQLFSRVELVVGNCDRSPRGHAC